MLSNDVSPKMLDAVFAALSNDKRRDIVQTLSFRPATVSQLAEEHHLSLPSIHRHIRALEEAQLLQRRKVGRTNFVALKRTALAAAQAYIAQYQLGWGHDDETLENYIDALSNKNTNKQKE
ncbi:MAG TPA: winged helix-turn-helix domain-containing protein [Candidatus Saccharimonadia bacterium]|nr:winged helix-turn-helix domain-containing protein [Candidatus Saccharimonadia bacterium]